jgi:phosphate transport system substrate-binding protein
MHPGIKIDVAALGSAKGVAELRAGAADIAMTSRGPLNNERDLFAFPIARDGVGIVVHRDNPVRDITTRQLTQVITGQILNWKGLGGRDAPIDLAWRSKGEGSTEFIMEALNVKREHIRRHELIASNADAIRFAATNPNGIAIANVGDSERSVRRGAAIKLLSFNGFEASTRTIQNHVYALSRPVTLLTRRLPEGLQKQFIDYATSGRVIDLQLKHGFVPYQE